MSDAQARTALSSAAEAAVVLRAAGGDDEAFAELVRRRQAWLRALLRRLCRDAALADDLAQQALLAAWQKLPQLRVPAAFGGWLRSLAVNLWLQGLRARRELLVDDIATLPQAPVAPGTDPSLALDLDRVLLQLRPAERVCVVLCHAEGMSHADIAAMTGWPLGTVKSHVTRGSARLRELLGEEALV
ncbi:MAG: RNA polymerase sigma factor [Steroidobacteraceae bacterium]